MLDDRKLAILRAIVTDYVSMREPIGSKALVERYQLDVSPATVRNDMAVLEEEGYITQPHTSAGSWAMLPPSWWTPAPPRRRVRPSAVQPRRLPGFLSPRWWSPTGTGTTGSAWPVSAR